MKKDVSTTLIQKEGALTKETKFAGDSYLWERMREYIPKNNIKSHLINELTCFKDDERFEMNK